jgi:hypothetical protein
MEAPRLAGGVAGCADAAIMINSKQGRKSHDNQIVNGCSRGNGGFLMVKVTRVPTRLRT